MQLIPKRIIAIATVIVITGFVFYHYFTDALSVAHQDAPSPVPVAKREMESTTTLAVKEVSATTTYVVPEADITHNVKFSLRLDKDNRILGVTMVEMPEEKASEKQIEFGNNLTVMIQGKKLSELTRVDRVGKSTLTTDAFNSVIDSFKAQL